LAKAHCIDIPLNRIADRLQGDLASHLSALMGATRSREVLVVAEGRVCPRLRFVVASSSKKTEQEDLALLAEGIVSMRAMGFGVGLCPVEEAAVAEVGAAEGVAIVTIVLAMAAVGVFPGDGQLALRSIPPLLYSRGTAHAQRRDVFLGVRAIAHALLCATTPMTLELFSAGASVWPPEAGAGINL
jgi:hypothetical protein